MDLLRGPISGLCSSPYGCTAAVLDLTSTRSRRFLHTFSVPSGGVPAAKQADSYNRRLFRRTRGRPMITREPTLERLAIAQSLMLEPFGLSEATLARALATIA